MTKINRFLSLLLAMVLVLGLIPVSANAASWQTGGNPEFVRVAGVNPHYADLFSAEDILSAIPEVSPIDPRPLADGYLDLESAAEVLRKGMAARENAIAVNFISTTKDHQAAGNELFALAAAHTGVPGEGDSLRWQYGTWGADMSRKSANGIYKFTCVFYVNYYTSAAQEAELDRTVAGILNDLQLAGKSDYDKIHAVYSYICDNVTYDYDNLYDDTYKLKYTPYAALINKTAVCQGYALAFYRLMLELGIDCRVIAGTGNGGAHGWNIVELDGLYYNVDTTWDADIPVSWRSYFLNSVWDFLDHERSMEYNTIAFHNEYPMAAKSYEAGVEAQIDPYIYGGYANMEGTARWYVNRDGTLEIEGKGACHDYTDDQIPYYRYWVDEITDLWVGEGITGIGTNSFAGFHALKNINFAGDAPSIASNAFTGVTATAYYPGTNATWTADKLNGYGGSITWHPEGVHIHSYEAVTTDPTCTEAGFTTYTCTCGECYVADAVEALGHEMGPWYTLVPVSCVENGIEQSDCVRCSHFQTRWIGATGHSYEAVVTSPTCTEFGFTTYICACGHSYEDNYEVPLGHEMVDGFCVRCGYMDGSLFSYQIVSGDHVVITGYNGESSDLVIPAEIEGLPVTDIDDHAFSYCWSLRSVTIPDSVKRIGDYAFGWCFSLEDITIPASVTSMGFGAFASCESMSQFRVDENNPNYSADDCGVLFNKDKTELIQMVCQINGVYDIPEGVVCIGDGAFENSQTITGVTIPDTVTSIGCSAFYGCGALVRIAVPASVTSIGEAAFEKCYILQEIHVDENNPSYCSDSYGVLFDKDKRVLIQAPCAISGAYTVPEGVTEIRENAFSNCGELAGVTIPASVVQIGYNAFSRCFKLTGFHVEENNLHYSSDSYGVLFDTEKMELLYAPAKISGAYSIPEGITDIREMAFFCCTRLAGVTIPGSVARIGDNAFDSCITLSEIRFCGDAPQFGWGVFFGATATVYYPAGNDTWTEDVKQNYDGELTWVAYEPSMEEHIHTYEAVPTAPTCTEQGFTTYTCACGECYVSDYVDALGHDYQRGVCSRCGYSVLVAKGWSGATQWVLTDDGTLTVYGKGNMKNYGYGGGQPWLGKGVDITKVVIEEGVTAVGSGAFRNLTTLQSVSLPENGLTKIGEAAFYGCTALKEINIPDSVYTVLDYTFKNCTALSDVRLSKNLIKVGQGAFENCTSLDYVFIPGNVEIIGSWSFKGCTSLESVDMRWADATEIRAGAFKNCTALTEIVLPSNIQVLGDSCFYGIGAKKFVVPGTVTKIVDWCFARSNLKEITFAGDAPAIGTGAFNKITLTAYYNSDNTTWTSDIMQNYGGTVTWKAN